MKTSDILILQTSLVPLYFYMGAALTSLIFATGLNGTIAILYLCGGSYAYSQAYQHIYLHDYTDEYLSSQTLRAS